MGLSDCKPVVNPRVNQSCTEDFLDAVLNEDEGASPGPCTVYPLRPGSPSAKIDPHVEYDDVVPYSSVYGSHPGSFMFASNGDKVPVKLDHCCYTGVSYLEMQVRRSECIARPAVRTQMFRRIFRNGAAWEVPTLVLLASVGKTCTKKRVGAKAVETAERFYNIGHELNDA